MPRRVEGRMRKKGCASMSVLRVGTARQCHTALVLGISGSRVDVANDCSSPDVNSGAVLDPRRGAELPVGVEAAE